MKIIFKILKAGVPKEKGQSHNNDVAIFFGNWRPHDGSGSAKKGHPIPAVRGLENGLRHRINVTVFQTDEFRTSVRTSCHGDKGKILLTERTITCNVCGNAFFMPIISNH